MNRSALLAFLLLLCGWGGAMALATATWPSAPVEQPLAFNHALHAKQDIPCAHCHPGVEDSAIASLPRLAVCTECHGEDTASTPEKERLLSFVAAGKEIPWARLYRLPAHVVFSHERHVALGGLECARCHGGHGASETPPLRPEPEVLRMDGCLSCHKAKGASDDCIACHK